MKRRHFIAGLASTTLGGATAVGTGAFSTVEANRTVNVTVADESQAYLALNKGSGQSSFARTGAAGGNGEISLDFNGSSGASGIGVGTDSTYSFDGVIQVTNQGTQSVYLKAPVSDASNDDSATGEITDAYFYVASVEGRPIDGDETGFDGTTEGEAWLKLPTGTSAQLGFFIDSTGASQTTQAEKEELSATFTAQVTQPGGTLVNSSGSTI
jgi:hypothetical protein